MMGVNLFNKIYSLIMNDNIALSFSVAILILFTISLLSHILLRNHLSDFKRNSPAILTTIGVLGTFTGILIGLLDFNVDNIDDSVPNLLEGLKVSFVTSIVGMFSAVILKFLQGFMRNSEESDEITPNIILSVLKDIRDENKKASEEQIVILAGLRDAISADGDTSLLTQLQKVRMAIQDGLGTLTNEFRHFAETVAENNSKALIEALEQVIRDFNAQLNEQFGENFKQLNQAVGALLEWQDNYKDHVERLEDQFERSLKGIGVAENSLTEIAGKTQAIPEAMERLAPVLQGLESQIAGLSAYLEAVAELRDKAIEAFPIIEDNLSKITVELSAYVQGALEESSRALEMQQAESVKLVSAYDELRDKTESVQDTFTAQITKTLTSIETQIEKAMEAHASALEDTSAKVRKVISDAWSQTEEAINQQMQALDQQMQNELQRVLTIFGSNLASLSEKFVQDYTPLTDRLREVVRVSERI